MMAMADEGGEEMANWELIRELTIEETAQSVSIKEDNNGNAFCLKDVEIFIVSMPTELDNGGIINMCLTADRAAPIFGFCNAAGSSDTKKYGYALYEKKAKCLVKTLGLQSTNGTNAIDSMNIFNTSLGCAANDDWLLGVETCEGIWIGSHYQSVLSPGTVIRVYGVRV